MRARPTRLGNGVILVPDASKFGSQDTTLWDGNRHVWVPVRWELPPRRHARWEPHRWVHRHEGWVFVEGHCR
jgi:hypothetical protein